MDQSQIHQALNRQHDSARALLQLLERESEAVVRGDVEELDRLTHDKKQRCAQLDTLGHQLAGWLGTRPLDQWLDRQSPPVRNSWDALSNTLRQCRRQNDANGLLISQRQLEIERKLRPADSGTYGSQGENLPQQGGSLNYRA